MNFSDNSAHQIALYFLDWDTTARISRVDILDASTGTVLDTRSVAKFSSGQYWIWNLSGHITIRVTTTGGFNSVLSGIFLGGK